MSTPRFGRFVLLWLVDLLSALGAGLTSFSLGIWVYTYSGSILDFSLVALCATAPAIGLYPVAGPVVDRIGPARVLFGAELVRSVTAIALAVLYATGNLTPLGVYLASGMFSATRGFATPALAAATKLMVDGERLGRAAGMTQVTAAFDLVLPPLVAGVVVEYAGYMPILTFEAGTCLVAAVGALAVGIPAVKATGQAQSTWQELWAGWHFIRARPHLRRLIWLGSLWFVINAASDVLFIPMALAFTSISTLGILLSISGVSMLLGSIAATVWDAPNPHRRMLVFACVSSVGLLVTGLRPNIILVAAGGVLAMSCLPMVMALYHTLWLEAVPEDLQGRVLASRYFLTSLGIPAAHLGAGALASSVLEPLLSSPSVAGSTLRAVFGAGEGRGTGLLLSALGLVSLVLTLAALIKTARGAQQSCAPVEPGVPEVDEA